MRRRDLVQTMEGLAPQVKTEKDQTQELRSKSLKKQPMNYI